MSLKKPSEYFNKKSEVSVNNSVQELVKKPELNSFSDAFESFKNNLSKIDVLSEFSETLDNYRVNVERVNYLSQKVEDIQSDIQSLLKKEDLDHAMMSQFLAVEQSIREVQDRVKGINEKNLTEIRLDVSGLSESVNQFLEFEVPKYKKLVVESEIRTNKRYEELEEGINETLEGIGEFIDKKYEELTETLQGINEKSLSSIIEEFKQLDESVLKFKEEEIPKYKSFIVETERKTDNKLNEFNETINHYLENFENKLNQTTSELLERIDIVDEDKTNLVELVNQKIDDVKIIRESIVKELKYSEEYKKQISKKVSDLESEIIRNESHIKSQNKNLEKIQKNVLSTIQKLNLEELEKNNYELGKKVKYLEEVFDKFSEKEILTESIITEPPSVDNKDPLTPLDKNYVTLEQLQQHYRLFINRIQQQLATLGGGGETRLKYLDDIVGIATNASAYDGKFLSYKHSLGKFEFQEVSSGISSQTLDDVLKFGNNSTLGMNVGVVTATEYYGSGKNLTDIVSGVGIGTTTSSLLGVGLTSIVFTGPGVSDIIIEDNIAIINIVGQSSQNYDGGNASTLYGGTEPIICGGA